MSLLHAEEPVKSFPHAARVRRAEHRASRFRQRGTLHTQHVNGRHIPDPAPVLDDHHIEQLHRRVRPDEPWEPDDYPRESPFGDSPGDARATRRLLVIYIAVVAITLWLIAP